MTRWNDTRFRLERFTELGMAIRRRRASTPVARGHVVWIHGLGESGLCFEAAISDPRLAAWHHVVPDLLGYGKSIWPEVALGLEQHAAGLDLLLDRLQIDSVVLVGHSMGGVIGTYLADRRRRRVRALVNVEGNISPADCTFSRVASGTTLDAFLDGVYDRALDDLYASVAAAEEPDDGPRERASVIRGYGASLQQCDPRTLHRNSADLVAVSDREQLAAQLAALDTV
ncbi:MAG: alpha/beta fold hydrolase, partial [Acidobacteriota bacterium]